MNGSAVFVYKARTMAEAVEAATTKWRDLCETPEADLPWSTNFDLSEDSEGAFDVVARVDFDQSKAPLTTREPPLS